LLLGASPKRDHAVHRATTVVFEPAIGRRGKAGMERTASADRQPAFVPETCPKVVFDAQVRVQHSGEDWVRRRRQSLESIREATAHAFPPVGRVRRSPVPSADAGASTYLPRANVVFPSTLRMEADNG